MREEYDSNKVKNLRKNPYVKRERTQVTICLDSEIVSYFKSIQSALVSAIKICSLIPAFNDIYK
jgi:hypothetical protein